MEEFRSDNIDAELDRNANATSENLDSDMKKTTENGSNHISEFAREEKKFDLTFSPASDDVNKGVSDDVTRTAEEDARLAKKEEWRILKNILLISLAFLFNFNSFQGLSRLQSSLNRVDGLGTITSSVIYGALVISCMFLPKLTINMLGHKWTMAVSFIGYIVYMAANGYAVWATMIPASILVGLCAAPLWTAQCSYFTIIATRYAGLRRETEAAVIARFFGIFFMFFQISSITGSIMSSTVLRPGQGNFSEPSDYDLAFCGAHDCPYNNVSNPNLDKPDSTTVWTLVGVYIGVALLAIVVVAFFVDPLPRELVGKKAEVKKEVLENLVATFRHLRHKEQLLLIPLTMYSGFEQTFFSAEFSKSYVTCSVGIWKVGLITLPYGITNALVAFIGGNAAKYVGRIPLFVAGACVDLCTQFTLMFWMPRPSEEYVLYIIATMWGFSDGIWQTQINGFYGALFSRESEAGFSNYRMWESSGFIVAFAYSSFLCTSTKLYVLTSMLLVGISGYGAVEALQYRATRKRVDVIDDRDVVK